jgi:predicted phage replisome organizer
VSVTKKYFWLKLRRDFFKRHDTKIIEAMDNGKDYLLFYLKLLVESIDHEGNLRFSDTIPYNDKMLSVITDTNIDIVRSAVKVFSELGMMDQMDDGTLFMSHVETMIGSETSDAVRMREIRENKKQIITVYEQVEQCSESFKNRSPELELELDKDLEKEEEETTFSLSESLNPNRATGEKLFQLLKATWNEAGLPKCSIVSTLNLTTDEREKWLAACQRIDNVSRAELAIQAYGCILKSIDHEASPAGFGFLGFLLKGIEQYCEDADPWTRCKKKQGPKIQTDEERRAQIDRIAEELERERT